MSTGSAGSAPSSTVLLSLPVALPVSATKMQKAQDDALQRCFECVTHMLRVIFPEFTAPHATTLEGEGEEEDDEMTAPLPTAQVAPQKERRSKYASRYFPRNNRALNGTPPPPLPRYCCSLGQPEINEGATGTTRYAPEQVFRAVSRLAESGASAALLELLKARYSAFLRSYFVSLVAYAAEVAPKEEGPAAGSPHHSDFIPSEACVSARYFFECTPATQFFARGLPSWKSTFEHNPDVAVAMLKGSSPSSPSFHTSHAEQHPAGSPSPLPGEELHPEAAASLQHPTGRLLRSLCWFWRDATERLAEVEDVWSGLPKHDLRRLCGEQSITEMGRRWTRDLLQSFFPVGQRSPVGHPRDGAPHSEGEAGRQRSPSLQGRTLQHVPRTASPPIRLGSAAGQSPAFHAAALPAAMANSAEGTADSLEMTAHGAMELALQTLLAQPACLRAGVLGYLQCVLVALQLSDAAEEKTFAAAERRTPSERDDDDNDGDGPRRDGPRAVKRPREETHVSGAAHRAAADTRDPAGDAAVREEKVAKNNTIFLLLHTFTDLLVHWGLYYQMVEPLLLELYRCYYTHRAGTIFLQNVALSVSKHLGENKRADAAAGVGLRSVSLFPTATYKVGAAHLAHALGHALAQLKLDCHKRSSGDAAVAASSLTAAAGRGGTTSMWERQSVGATAATEERTSRTGILSANSYPHLKATIEQAMLLYYRTPAFERLQRCLSSSMPPPPPPHHMDPAAMSSSCPATTGGQAGVAAPSMPSSPAEAEYETFRHSVTTGHPFLGPLGLEELMQEPNVTSLRQLWSLMAAGCCVEEMEKIRSGFRQYMEAAGMRYIHRLRYHLRGPGYGAASGPDGAAPRGSGSAQRLTLSPGGGAPARPPTRSPPPPPPPPPRGTVYEPLQTILAVLRLMHRGEEVVLLCFAEEQKPFLLLLREVIQMLLGAESEVLSEELAAYADHIMSWHRRPLPPHLTRALLETLRRMRGDSAAGRWSSADDFASTLLEEVQREGGGTPLAGEESLVALLRELHRIVRLSLFTFPMARAAPDGERNAAGLFPCASPASENRELERSTASSASAARDSSADEAFQQWVEAALRRAADLCTMFADKSAFRVAFQRLLARRLLLRRPAAVMPGGTAASPTHHLPDPPPPPPPGRGGSGTTAACRRLRFTGEHFFVDALQARCGQRFTSAFGRMLREVENEELLGGLFRRWCGCLGSEKLVIPAQLRRDNTNEDDESAVAEEIDGGGGGAVEQLRRTGQTYSDPPPPRMRVRRAEEDELVSGDAEASPRPEPGAQSTEEDAWEDITEEDEDFDDDDEDDDDESYSSSSSSSQAVDTSVSEEEEERDGRRPHHYHRDKARKSRALLRSLPSPVPQVSLLLIGRSVWPPFQPFPLTLGTPMRLYSLAQRRASVGSLQGWANVAEGVMDFYRRNFDLRCAEWVPQLSSAVLRVHCGADGADSGTTSPPVEVVEVVGDSVQCAILFAVQDAGSQLSIAQLCDVVLRRASAGGEKEEAAGDVPARVTAVSCAPASPEAQRQLLQPYVQTLCGPAFPLLSLQRAGLPFHSSPTSLSGDDVLALNPSTAFWSSLPATYHKNGRSPAASSAGSESSRRNNKNKEGPSEEEEGLLPLAIPTPSGRLTGDLLRQPNVLQRLRRPYDLSAEAARLRRLHPHGPPAGVSPHGARPSTAEDEADNEEEEGVDGVQDAAERHRLQREQEELARKARLLQLEIGATRVLKSVCSSATMEELLQQLKPNSTGGSSSGGSFDANGGGGGPSGLNAGRSLRMKFDVQLPELKRAVERLVDKGIVRRTSEGGARIDDGNTVKNSFLLLTSQSQLYTPMRIHEVEAGERNTEYLCFRVDMGRSLPVDDNDCNVPLPPLFFFFFFFFRFLFSFDMGVQFGVVSNFACAKESSRCSSRTRAWSSALPLVWSSALPLSAAESTAPGALVLPNNNNKKTLITLKNNNNNKKTKQKKTHTH
eukprot:gene13430-9241_t